MPVIPPHESREDGQVALYARTVVGDPANSLEVQVEALHEYTRRHRLETLRVYFEPPGARGQFHEMMAEATGENPPFRRILVHNMGRLSRWADGLSALRDRLEANGVTVVTVTEPAGEKAIGRDATSRPGLAESEEALRLGV